MSGEGRQSRRPNWSDFYSLGECQRIFELDSKIPNGAIHFGVAEQELDGTQVAGLLVDLRHFCAPHRVYAISAGFQSNRRHPVADDPRVLAGRDMQLFVKAARPHVLGANHQRLSHPSFERATRAFRHLEPHRLLRLALQHGSPFLDLARYHDVGDLHLDQVAAAQLTIYR